MKKNSLSELTAEELNKQKSSLIKILLASGIVMLILFTVSMYIVLRYEKSSAQVAIIPVCLVFLLPALIKLSQVNTEIKSRSADVNQTR
jgi:flagellar basal body-associated protein FliL